MLSDEKGQFTKEETGFTLTLPSPICVIKYLFILHLSKYCKFKSKKNK